MIPLPAAGPDAQPARPVAYLGPAGTFTGIAAKAMGAQTLYPFAHVEPAVRAVVEGRVEKAVLPWINSRVGPVEESFHVLRRYVGHVKAVEATILPINLCLYRKASDTDPVTKLLGHPAALAQCQFRARTMGWELVTASSNGAALKTVAESAESGLGALGPAHMADYAALTTDGIAMQDAPAHTMFLAVKAGRGGATGCLILFDNEDAMDKARAKAGRAASSAWAGDMGCLLFPRPMSTPPEGMMLGLHDGDGLPAAFP